MRGTTGARNRAAAQALACAVLGVSLTGLTGCGVVDRVMTTPTITAVPSRPDEITPTVAVPGGPGATGDGAVTGHPAAATAGTGTPATTPATGGATGEDTTDLPAPDGLDPMERLVIVDSLGLGFAAPTLFMEVDPEKYLEGSAALDELAQVMRMTPQALRRGLLDTIDRMVIGRADDGRAASLVVARTPLEKLPSSSVTRKEIGRLRGGTVTDVVHLVTPAGEAVKAVYRMDSGPFLQYGEAYYVRSADGAIASVAVTSFSRGETSRLSARVAKTLRVIE